MDIAKWTMNNFTYDSFIKLDISRHRSQTQLIWERKDGLTGMVNCEEGSRPIVIIVLESLPQRMNVD